MPTAERRLTFIDAVRGGALVLMVVNHTARDWMDGSMGWGRYYLIYGSLLLPAAIFLFLVGFSLPIGYRGDATPPQFAPLLSRFVRRGAGIALAGYLLNALILREQPVWSGGVLQTIGLAIVVAGAALPLAHRYSVRWTLVALAAGVYAAFVAAAPALARWSTAHPVAARALFNDFPAWPWVVVAVLGLVVGWSWLDARAEGPAREARFFTRLAIGGVACLIVALVWEALAPAPGAAFARDISLNRHWTPRGATTLVVAGGVALALALSYWLVERQGIAASSLVVLGQTALILYVVHQAIELTLVKELLGVRVESWWLYALMNAAFLVLLVALGRTWRGLRTRLRGGPGLPRDPGESRPSA